MKKTTIILLIATTLLAPKFLQTEYTLTTEVKNVIQPTDEAPEGIVICQGENGKFYTFEGSEDWIEGDIAELTYSDNGTPYRLDDDKLLKTIYRGYIY